ncbi:MAG: Zn-ribbon domain-containing OB-fold protein [archaeon]|jgi:hypothetical protein
MFRESPIIRWRSYGDHYRLKGYQCAKCKATFFEKKGLCTCGSLEFNEIDFSGNGKIIAFTQIHSGPEVFENKSPYCVALIDLEEGARIEAQVMDCKFEDLKAGMEVEAVFRKFYSSGEKGVIHYGTKFIPKF